MNNIKWSDNTETVGKTCIHACFDNESWRIVEQFDLTGVKFIVTSCCRYEHPRKMPTTKYSRDYGMGYYLVFWLDSAGQELLRHLGFNPEDAKWWSKRDTYLEWV